MRIGIRVAVWIIVVFLSILLFVLGYGYAYAILPSDILEAGTRQLTEIAQEAFELLEEPNPRSILGVSMIILANNAMVNTLFAIPFAGPVFYAYVVTLTGAVLRYFIDAQAIPVPHEEVLVFMLISPHVYLEFLGYSITVTESVRIAIAIVRRSISRRDFVEYLLLLGLSYAVLFIAALVEATTMVAVLR